VLSFGQASILERLDLLEPVARYMLRAPVRRDTTPTSLVDDGKFALAFKVPIR